jgi:hypothetical protein
MASPSTEVWRAGAFEKTPFVLTGFSSQWEKAELLLRQACVILEAGYDRDPSNNLAHKLALLHEALGSGAATVARWDSCAKLHSLEAQAKDNLFELANANVRDAPLQLKRLRVLQGDGKIGTALLSCVPALRKDWFTKLSQRSW